MDFSRHAINVTLRDAPHRIMMIVRCDFPVYDSAIVFADPARLAPLMQQITGGVHPAGKYHYALEGLDEAARNADTCTVPGPDENPLPLAMVNCWGPCTPQLSFTDGLTRTAALLDKGADFIPLQVHETEAAALHALVGGTIAPEPATKYVVPHERRLEHLFAYKPA